MEVGGYHEVSVGPYKILTGEGGALPDTKYVEVTGNQNTAVLDRTVQALLGQSMGGHVQLQPLNEPVTVITLCYPVISSQIPNPGIDTNYVVTSHSLPTMLKINMHECKQGSIYTGNLLREVGKKCTPVCLFGGKSPQGAYNSTCFGGNMTWDNPDPDLDEDDSGSDTSCDSDYLYSNCTRGKGPNTKRQLKIDEQRLKNIRKLFEADEVEGEEEHLLQPHEQLTGSTNEPSWLMLKHVGSSTHHDEYEVSREEPTSTEGIRQRRNPRQNEAQAEAQASCGPSGGIGDLDPIPPPPILKRTRCYDQSSDPEFQERLRATTEIAKNKNIMSHKEYEDGSKMIARNLRYNIELPSDDQGGVPKDMLVSIIGTDVEKFDRIILSSQGSKDLRFEEISYGEPASKNKLKTIRARYKIDKDSTESRPELVHSAYSEEAAYMLSQVLSTGVPPNTLGVFNDLFPGCEKYKCSVEKLGSDHQPIYKCRTEFRCFDGLGVAATKQDAKALAVGKLLAKAINPTNQEHFAQRIVFDNRVKKILRAYGCLGRLDKEDLLSKITAILTTRGETRVNDIARILGTTTKSVNQTLYAHSTKFKKVGERWELVVEDTSPIYSKIFTRGSAIETTLNNFGGVDTPLRQIVMIHLQVPARYACLALSMTAGSAGNTNISYFSTRFRTVLTDDEAIPNIDIDTYDNALTAISYIVRNSGTIPHTNYRVDYKGQVAIDMLNKDTISIDEKFLALETEKRPRAGMHIIASYDATDFTGQVDEARCIVTKNLQSTQDVDKPYSTYRALQTAPNLFGLPGPLCVKSNATLLSAMIRHLTNSKKTLAEGVESDISKHALKGEQRKKYQQAMKIIADGDAELVKKAVSTGRVGADHQTPPARFTEQEKQDLYAKYVDFYDRGHYHDPTAEGPRLHNRVYVLLGVIEHEKAELMKTFLKRNETDNRGRMIQPTATNDGHAVCNGNVVKIIAETVKLARPCNLFKGLTDNGKKHYFGEMRVLASKLNAKLHSFDRSKQDWLTSLLLLEAYEDYMTRVSDILEKSGIDMVSNTMYSTKNKATKATFDEFVLRTEHIDAMLPSAVAQTSDANRFKTETEALVLLLDKGWSIEQCKAVYNSWNNPNHRRLTLDCDGNEVYVPTEAMDWPLKYEGDDANSMDKYGIFETDDKAHCVYMAGFNRQFSTSWIPSAYARDHGALSPIDTLSILYFADCDRQKQNQSTKLPSGRADFAIPHPVKKAQSLVAMDSPANIKVIVGDDNITRPDMTDHARAAIVTAKTAQAESMKDSLWLRRVATQSANYFLKNLDNPDAMRNQFAVWDPRDPQARGIVADYEVPIVQKLVEVDSNFTAAEESKELLIANAESWKLTCSSLSNVPVVALAAELVCLDNDFNDGGISVDDFDIRFSSNRVRMLAPNIARVCDAAIGRTVGRLEKIPEEGSQSRLEEQKEVVAKLLAVGVRTQKNKNAVTKEQSPKGSWFSYSTPNHKWGQRRSPSDETSSSGDWNQSSAGAKIPQRW